MASLLGSRTASRRSRGVSHGGGLGGCRPIDTQDKNEIKDKPTWQLRRRKRPASLQVSLQEQGIAPLSAMTPHSLVVHESKIHEHERDSNHDIGGDNEISPLEKDLPELPLVIRRDVSTDSPAVFDSTGRPQTPQMLQDSSPRPVELPGSILLPHGGFPQDDTPPVSPLSLKSTDRASEGSRSRTPSLDTSNTTDSEMDIFRNLKSPQQGKSNTHSSAIFGRKKKPLRAMSADELMECLPELNKSVVAQSWVPAMQDELERIRGLLHDAAEKRLQSHADLELFGKDVNSIAVSARDISRTYSDLMQRVGPLVDNDAKAVCERLEATEAELRIALAAVEDNQSTISDKEVVIRRLRETLAANFQIFGGFIQDHAGGLLNRLQDLGTQEIKDLIRDQQRHLSDGGNGPQGGFVWIPEKQYSSYVGRLQCTQQQLEQYSEVAKDQLELIRSQSADLDKRLDKYAECMTILDRRQARILELESSIGAKEKELIASKNADTENAEARDLLNSGNETLRKHCTELEAALEEVRHGLKRQLENKDTEISALRQRLGETVLDTGHHRSESMAGGPQLTTSTTSWQLNDSLGGEREKNADQDQSLSLRARRALLGRKLPDSQSMLSLNNSEASLTPDKLSIPRKTAPPSSNAAIRPRNHTFSVTDQSSGKRSGKGSGSGRLFSGLRLNPPNSSIPLTASQASVIQSRVDSPPTARPIPVTAISENISNGNGNRPQSTHFLNRQKALPSPPTHPSQPVNAHHLNEGGSNSKSNSSQNAAKRKFTVPTRPVNTNSPGGDYRTRSATVTSTTTTDKSLADTASSYSQDSGNATTDGSTTTGGISNSRSLPSASSSDQAAFRSSMALLNRFATQDQQQQRDRDHRPAEVLEKVERGGGEASTAPTSEDRDQPKNNNSISAIQDVGAVGETGHRFYGRRH